jgi:uncharacterized protein
VNGFRIYRADSFASRLFGWLGRYDIRDNELLWLTHCRCVHTIGMQIDIALLFVDSRGVIVRVIACAKPGRIYACWQARSVIEARACHVSHQRWVERLTGIQAAILNLV